PPANTPDLHSFPTRRSSDLWTTFAPRARQAQQIATQNSSHSLVASFLWRDWEMKAKPSRLRKYFSSYAAPGSASGQVSSSQTTKDRKSTRLNSSHVSISYAV